MPRKAKPRPDLPPAIRGKITEYRNAVAEAAFAGSYDKADMDASREAVVDARYNLEETIRTHLARNT